jgi:hypothetical protein
VFGDTRFNSVDSTYRNKSGLHPHAATGKWTYHPQNHLIQRRAWKATWETKQEFLGIGWESNGTCATDPSALIRRSTPSMPLGKFRYFRWSAEIFHLPNSKPWSPMHVVLPKQSINDRGTLFLTQRRRSRVTLTSAAHWAQFADLGDQDWGPTGVSSAAVLVYPRKLLGSATESHFAEGITSWAWPV